MNNAENVNAITEEKKEMIEVGMKVRELLEANGAVKATRMS